MIDQCKERAKAYDAKYRAEHKDQVRAANKRWVVANKDKVRATAARFRNTDHSRQYQRDWKRAKYQRAPAKWREIAWARSGIDLKHWSYTDFVTMLNAQSGRCLGCNCNIVATKVEAVGNFRIAVVDHDHNTDHVRGLLCKHCNQALGFAGDDPAVLESLARYLSITKELDYVI